MMNEQKEVCQMLWPMNFLSFMGATKYDNNDVTLFWHVFPCHCNHLNKVYLLSLVEWLASQGLKKEKEEMRTLALSMGNLHKATHNNF